MHQNNGFNTSNGIEWGHLDGCSIVGDCFDRGDVGWVWGRYVLCWISGVYRMGERVDARITRFLCDTREVELLS
jgi:hypothetical protein